MLLGSFYCLLKNSESQMFTETRWVTLMCKAHLGTLATSGHFQGTAAIPSALTLTMFEHDPYYYIYSAFPWKVRICIFMWNLQFYKIQLRNLKNTEKTKNKMKQIKKNNNSNNSLKLPSSSVYTTGWHNSSPGTTGTIGYHNPIRSLGTYLIMS